MCPCMWLWEVYHSAASVQVSCHHGVSLSELNCSSLSLCLSQRAPMATGYVNECIKRGRVFLKLSYGISIVIGLQLKVYDILHVFAPQFLTMLYSYVKSVTINDCHGFLKERQLRWVWTMKNSGTNVSTKLWSIEATCIISGDRWTLKTVLWATKTFAVASEQGFNDFLYSCLRTRSMA